MQEKLGAVLFTAGRYDEALEILPRAVEAYRTQRDLEAAGRVTARMGMAHRYRGTPEEGMALVQPMVEILTPHGPAPALASLHLALANLTFFTGRSQEMQEAAERAGQIARAIGDDRLLGEAEERRATALSELGHPDQALPIYQQAIPSIERGGDLLVLWRTLNNASSDCSWLARMPDAMRYMERALTIAERIGNLDNIAFVLGGLGDLLTTLGQWKEAREHLERAVALLGEERTPNAGNPLFTLGVLAMYEGKWDEAATLLNEALAVSQQTGNRHAVAERKSVVAELDILTGRPAEAVHRLEDGVVTEDASPSYQAVLARALLETGAVERASQVVMYALHRMRADESPSEGFEVLLAHGMVLTRQGLIQEAASAFNEALGNARTSSAPYAEAGILFQLGLLEQQRGDPDEARTRLDDALVIFRRLGALKDIEQVEETLHGLACTGRVRSGLPGGRHAC